jgi:phosphate transport system protein
VDALHDSVFKTLVARMASDPAAIAPAMQLVLVSRNLERVADMATNIGEDAVYLAVGKQIKHHHEERSSARQQG